MTYEPDPAKHRRSARHSVIFSRGVAVLAVGVIVMGLAFLAAGQWAGVILLVQGGTLWSLSRSALLTAGTWETIAQTDESLIETQATIDGSSS